VGSPMSPELRVQRRVRPGEGQAADERHGFGSPEGLVDVARVAMASRGWNGFEAALAALVLTWPRSGESGQ
jgi:hypothetical protein